MTTRQIDEVRLTTGADARRHCLVAAKDYLARTGMTPADFATRIGYSYSTVRHFLDDRYQNVSGNSDHFVAAANKYMAAYPVGTLRDVAGELFETANVRLIRETFAKLLLRPRAFMIYAPPGSQKSFVLEKEIHALNARNVSAGEDAARAYYVYARNGIKPSGLVKRIAKQCATRMDGSTDRILNNICFDHAHRRSLLIIDEAQHMSLDCFEVVRELLDRPPFFSLLFAGSHDLFLKFERHSATWEQWNSRIAQKVRLPGCTRAEATGIVEREVGYILDAQSLSPTKRDAFAGKLIDRATVPDAYVPVAQGQPKATYINIRTLCNALDDLRTEYEAAAQKASAA